VMGGSGIVRIFGENVNGTQKEILKP